MSDRIVFFDPPSRAVEIEMHRVEHERYKDWKKTQDEPTREAFNMWKKETLLELTLKYHDMWHAEEKEAKAKKMQDKETQTSIPKPTVIGQIIITRNMPYDVWAKTQENPTPGGYYKWRAESQRELSLQHSLAIGEIRPRTSEEDDGSADLPSRYVKTRKWFKSGKW